MTGWVKMTLGELLSRDGGSIKTGPFGTTLKAAEYSAEGVPLISVGEIGEGAIRVHKKTPRVSPDVTSRLGQYLLEQDDIVFARKGAVDRSARVKASEGGYFLGSDGIRLRLPATVCAEFVGYQITSRRVRAWLRQHAGGTTMPSLNQGTIERIPLVLPPLAEQRRIAGVLGALDDLIEVNRGLIMGLLETVDAEFSREFVHRDLTLTLGSFTKIVDCLHSKKPERVETSHRLLQLSNIDDSGQLETSDFYGISRDDYVRWTKNLETREWDCVITNVGRVGAVARIPSGVHAALGRNMTAIRPIDPESDGAFVIAGLRAQPVRREIELKTDSGTVMDALNVKNIPSLRLPQASSDERAAFQSFAAPLLRAADDLRSENSLLASTRDELLPLLMSGRVRVRENEVAA